MKVRDTLVMLSSALVLLQTSSGVAAQTQGVDWKFVGAAQAPVEYLFYDAKGVQRLPGNHVRVWIKGYLETQTKKVLEGTPDNNLVERTAQLLIAGYKPPLSSVVELKEDDLPLYILLEQWADKTFEQPSTKLLWEIDCQNQMIRTLSLQRNVSGKSVSKTSADDWQYIPPESNASNAMRLICH